MPAIWSVRNIFKRKKCPQEHDHYFHSPRGAVGLKDRVEGEAIGLRPANVTCASTPPNTHLPPFDSRVLCHDNLRGHPIWRSRKRLTFRDRVRQLHRLPEISKPFVLVIIHSVQSVRRQRGRKGGMGCAALQYIHQLWC